MEPKTFWVVMETIGTTLILHFRAWLNEISTIDNIQTRTNVSQMPSEGDRRHPPSANQRPVLWSRDLSRPIRSRQETGAPVTRGKSVWRLGTGCLLSHSGLSLSSFFSSDRSSRKANVCLSVSSLPRAIFLHLTAGSIKLTKTRAWE